MHEAAGEDAPPSDLIAREVNASQPGQSPQRLCRQMTGHAVAWH